MDNEAVSQDLDLLKDLAEYDSIIRRFGGMGKLRPEQVEELLGQRRRMSPDSIRRNLAELRGM
jgi:hypothetical protein